MYALKPNSSGVSYHHLAHADCLPAAHLPLPCPSCVVVSRVSSASSGETGTLPLPPLPAADQRAAAASASCAPRRPAAASSAAITPLQMGGDAGAGFNVHAGQAG